MTRFKDWVAALPLADDITPEDLIVVVQSGVSKRLPASEAMSPIRGDYSMADNDDLPSTGGRMSDGTPKAGDKWRFTDGPGTIAGIDFDTGVIAEAWIDTPGQDIANWRFYY